MLTENDRGERDPSPGVAVAAGQPHREPLRCLVPRASLSWSSPDECGGLVGRCDFTYRHIVRSFTSDRVQANVATGALAQTGAGAEYGGGFERVARIRDRPSVNGSATCRHGAATNDASSPLDIGDPLPVTPDHTASLFGDDPLPQGPPGGPGPGAGARCTSRSAGRQMIAAAAAAF